MELKLTYGNIWNYHNQIQKQIMADAVCAYFNKSKIKQFYNDFGFRVQTIRTDITAVQEKYFTRDEKTKQFITEEVEGKKRWKPKEGLKVEDYNIEIDKIMSREILV